MTRIDKINTKTNKRTDRHTEKQQKITQAEIKTDRHKTGNRKHLFLGDRIDRKMQPARILVVS